MTIESDMHNPDETQPVESGDVPNATTQAEVPSAGIVEPSAEVPAADEAATQADGPTVEEELAEARRQRDENLDSWRRTAADFQNFKKREEKMRIERERAANSRLLTRLLPVMDDLQRAAKHIPEGWGESDWTKGILAIERKLWTVLEQEGVTVIDTTPGIDLDPAVHEALITLPNDEIESGNIVDELERGYRLRDLVLRPARVAVAQ